MKYMGMLLLLSIPSILHAQGFRTLQSFNGSNGAVPEGVALVQGRDGALYGTTSSGGAFDAGTVFRLKPGFAVQTLYSFCAQPNCTDGSYPQVGLVLGNDGDLYGVTFNGGGANNRGTVFKISTSGQLTTLYSFCLQSGCPDGAYPQKLTLSVDGNFYGTAAAGGNANGGGTIFKITASGTLTTLYQFCSQANCLDGQAPNALIQASGGNFYGTTAYGGPPSGLCPIYGCGTIFKVTPAGTLTTLYDFCQRSCPDPNGYNPLAGLVQASDGDFYGTTLNGGAYADFGTLFRFSPSGEFTTLHSFCYAAGCPDGTSPRSAPIQATDGNLYGTTGVFSGQGCNGGSGDGDCGTIYSISPQTGFGTLFLFCTSSENDPLSGFHCPDGAGPLGGIMQATNGFFYGTTTYGGAFGGSFGDGTVFKFSMAIIPFVSFVEPVGRVGQTVGVLGQTLTGSTSVMLNGTPMSYRVNSDTFLQAIVPTGATSGYVTVTTASGMLTSNVPFRVIP